MKNGSFCRLSGLQFFLYTVSDFIVTLSSFVSLFFRLMHLKGQLSTTSLSNISDLKNNAFLLPVPDLFRVETRIVEGVLISKGHTQGS